MVIYPVDSIIHPLNNWGLVAYCLKDFVWADIDETLGSVDTSNKQHRLSMKEISACNTQGAKQMLCYKAK